MTWYVYRLANSPVGTGYLMCEAELRKAKRAKGQIPPLIWYGRATDDIDALSKAIAAEALLDGNKIKAIPD